MSIDAFTEPSTDPRAAAPLTAALHEQVRRRHIPGLTIAVVRHDRLLYTAAVGSADLAERRAATVRTPYLWFSMSKIATATAAVALAESGGLDLDAPITDYLPDYPAAAPVVGQLLTHTAGLGNPPPIRWVHRAGTPGPEPAAFLADRLDRRTCTRHRAGGPPHYSNLGYLVLGQVLAAAREPVIELVTRTVLRPAGMHRTGYRHPGDDAATGYVRLPRPAVPVLRAVLPPGIVGARHGRFQAFRPFLVDGPAYGGLVGDVVDAARLAALHLGDGRAGGHQIISPAAARRMRTISAVGHKRDHGQGWFRPAAARAARPAYVEHLGSGGGFHNLMRIYPDLDLGVVIMSNSTNGPDHDHICSAAAAIRWS